MVDKCKSKQINEKAYRCYFELTLKVIGGKWKPVIVYHLAQEGIMRFGELKRSMPDITQRMLTKQLRELEEDGLIFRNVYREVPPKVEYSLKEAGVNLIPVLMNMREWGKSYEKLQIGKNKHEEGFEPCGTPKIADMYNRQL
ncbi:winged helix-turn-helix transcriptional regulator [Desulfogranum marinum]|uniref:winged helix-turn-helix transcriptional regulator n=2 Tax=Desulfogranum marinum TaxID=453220 RepID=UPI00196495C9|nr:helix-turn-helix domain-containing protein [Desulfogranum marinum]MBM9512607.1 helix-turn-helix transcriptional regulator [Desulfogranum marinum]